MGLTGAKFQEASLGQYGSCYLGSDGHSIDLNENNNPEATRLVCSITFLEDSQFEELHTKGGMIGSISTEASEQDFDNATAGIGASANGEVIGTGASCQVFPKGITIFGRWDFIELHSGACICYFAPI